MISLQAYSDLLATLHAAPLDDEHWQEFLVRICEYTESVYGIFTSNDSTLERRILAHSGMPQFAQAHKTYNESFRHRDPFRERFLRQPRVGVIEGSDICPNQELVKTDLYREFLTPMQLHHSTFMVLSMSQRKYELISMWRGAERPRLSPESRQLLTLIMPHIQTSLQVRQVLAASERRAQNAEALLNSSATASILLDEEGSILFMNTAARQLTEEADGLRVYAGQLVPTDASVRMKLRSMILAAAAPARNDPGGAIGLDRPSGNRPLQMMIAPFRPTERFRSPARVLVLVSDPEQKIEFPDAVLRSLYDLTPAETEIANGLMTGFSLDEVALLRKVSRATVRSQMKTILGKTATRRQGDLVRLLATLPRTAGAVRQFLRQ